MKKYTYMPVRIGSSVMDLIKGKRVVNMEVADCSTIDMYKDEDGSTTIECYGGDIIITLDDGTVLEFWTSEFGGVTIKPKYWAKRSDGWLTKSGKGEKEK